MLYNSQWEQPKKDVFSLDSLIEWLETKRANDEYNYNNRFKCLICQYFDAMGIIYFNVSRYDWHQTHNDFGRLLPKHFDMVAESGLTTKRTMVGRRYQCYTFGKALEKAKEIRERHNNAEQVFVSQVSAA